MKHNLSKRVISSTVLLTMLVLCGCAAGPSTKDASRQDASPQDASSRQLVRKDKPALEPDCVPQNAAMHCISGERLRSYGYTPDALRLALFPWVSLP